MAAHPSYSPLPNNGALTLLRVQMFSVFPLLWLPTPQPSAYCSLPHSILLPSPLGCLHTTNPSRLPGTDLWILGLGAPPYPSISFFGLCASGSDYLCSSHSAFQFSDLLLRFSQHLGDPSDLADLSVS